MAGRGRASLVRVIVSEFTEKTSRFHLAVTRLSRGSRMLLGLAVLLACGVPFGFDLMLLPDIPLSQSSQGEAKPSLGQGLDADAVPLWILVAMGLLIFAIVCVNRRAVIVMVCLAFAVSNWIVPLVSGWQLLAFFCASIGMVFVYEAIFQNLPLALMLIRNPKALLHAMGKAAVIWSPVLLLIAAGFYLNKVVTRNAETLLFIPESVTRYCTSGALPGHKIPCDQTTKPSTAQVTTPEFASAVHLSLLDRVNASQRKWVGALVEAPDEAFADSKSLGAFLQNKGLKTSATEVAGFGPLISRDPEVVRLNEELASVSAQLNALNRRLRSNRIRLDVFGLREVVLQIENMNPRSISLRKRRLELVQNLQLRTASLTAELSVGGAELNEALASQSQQLPPVLDLQAITFPQELSAMDRRMQVALAVISGHQTVLDRLPDILISVRKTLDGDQAKQKQKDSAKALTDRMRFGYCELALLPRETVAINEPAHRFDCSSLSAGQSLIDISPIGIEESFRDSVDAWKKKQLASTEQALRSAVEDLKAGRMKSVDAAMALDRLVPKRVDLGRDGCNGWVFDFPDCFKDKIKEKGEGLYAKQRLAAGNAYTKEVKQTAETGQARSMESLIDGRNAVLNAADSVAKQAHSNIQRSFDAYKYFLLSSAILLTMACIRSALTSFSIAAFDARGIATFGLSTSDHDRNKVGNIDITPSLRLSTGDRTTLTTRAVLHNQEKRIVFMPWPFFAVLARMRSGCYWLMNRGARYPGTKLPLLATLGSSEAFVHWEMKPGEKVVFVPSKLFGVSKNVSLRTEVSLRISTLMLGRMTFAVAECSSGQGHLFLLTSDQATQVGVCTTEVDRLIAWSRHMQFQVVSARSFWTLVRDGFTIKVPPGARATVGKVVIEPVGQGVGTVKRIWKTLATMLSPF